MMVKRDTVDALRAGKFNRSLGIDPETVERRTGRKTPKDEPDKPEEEG